MTTPIDRFWTYVNKARPDGCWEWAGGRSKNGYGVYRLNGTMQYAHRIAYSLTYGQVPRSRKICHHCDNPPCCNPAHLFVGTDRDNLVDSIQKGRRPTIGEGHWKAKLTEADVKKIRKLAAEGTPQTKIAAMFNVNQSTIQRILSGRSWAHVS